MSYGQGFRRLVLETVSELHLSTPSALQLLDHSTLKRLYLRETRIDRSFNSECISSCWSNAVVMAAAPSMSVNRLRHVMSSTAATPVTAEAEQLPRKGPRKGAAKPVVATRDRLHNCERQSVAQVAQLASKLKTWPVQARFCCEACGHTAQPHHLHPWPAPCHGSQKRHTAEADESREPSAPRGRRGLWELFLLLVQWPSPDSASSGALDRCGVAVPLGVASRASRLKRVGGATQYTQQH